MPTPEPTPTDPRPDQAPTPKEGPTAPQSTQENMGDGAGIRGDYGNASQTNGLEGGPAGPEPEQAMTDTELTGS